MSKQIRTYDDLLTRKQQLEALMTAQKELVRYDFRELTEEFEPVRKSISALGRFLTRDRSSLLLAGGASSLIDLIVKKGILARAGWVTRTLIPSLLKNLSSNYIAEHKHRWFDKLFSWMSPMHQNGKTEHKENEEY